MTWPLRSRWDPLVSGREEKKKQKGAVAGSRGRVGLLVGRARAEEKMGLAQVSREGWLGWPVLIFFDKTLFFLFLKAKQA